MKRPAPRVAWEAPTTPSPAVPREFACDRCGRFGHIERNCTREPARPAPLRQKTPHTFTSESAPPPCTPSDIGSEFDLVIAAFSKYAEKRHIVATAKSFAEQVHTASPLKTMTHVWPMVRHAAQPRFGLTATYFAKVLDRYGDELTELDLSTAAPDEVASIENMISRRVLLSLRVLRGVSRPEIACCAPHLEELYGRDDSCPAAPLFPAAPRATGEESQRLAAATFPFLRKSTLDMGDALLPRIEHATLSVTPPAEALGVLLEESPLITSLEIDRVDLEHIEALVDSCVAPTLRHFSCDNGAVKGLEELTSLPKLESLRIGGPKVMVSTVLSTLPNLTKLHLRSGWPGLLPSLESFARLNTLDLQFGRDGFILPPGPADLMEPPPSIALQNLRCINCPLPDSFINAFIHPGLKYLELTNIRCAVFDALKWRAPRLHTLILSGNCDTEGAATDYRQRWNFNVMMVACGRKLVNFSFYVRFRFDGVQAYTFQLPHTVWVDVGRACPKLRVLRANFLTSRDNMPFLHTLHSCRRMQSLTCIVDQYCVAAVARACAPLTVRRDLVLEFRVYNHPSEDGRKDVAGTIVLFNGVEIQKREGTLRTTRVA